jgi:ubiquinone/menaquinone biosynthesis C-methylase UbiE
MSRLFRRVVPSRPMAPVAGYDRWSRTYDSEADNVLLALDQSLFEALLCRVQVRGKRVVDVGCGTGRHWATVLSREPAELVGYDVSPGMLERLKRRYPDAAAHLAGAHDLARTNDESCDLVVSTLAFSHFPSADAALREWARVLPPGGDALLTDVHPVLAATSTTMFRSGGRTLRIRTYVRPLSALKAAFARGGFEVLAVEERLVDETTKQYFVNASARLAFDEMKGMPCIYGVHLRKLGSGSVAR